MLQDILAQLLVCMYVCIYVGMTMYVCINH